MAETVSNLVIGIGNPLRGDDGVGWWLAERAEALQPAPQVRRVQQLTPELAEDLAGAGRVLFIDAWWPQPDPSSDQPCLLRLQASSGETNGSVFSHQLDPAQLLAITLLLYGRMPQAWMLLMPARSMPHRRGLSCQMRAQVPQAEGLLRSWCAWADQHHA